MKIVNEFDAVNLIKTCSGRRIFRDGREEAVEEPLIAEHTIEIYVNDAHCFSITCLAELLPELVLGRMLTEGMVSAAEDVEEVRISKDGARADVRLREGVQERTEPGMLSSIHWKREWVFELADFFSQGTPLYYQTHAAHNSILSMEGNILVRCEDTGRHHALDKVAGYALKEGIDLSRCMLFFSGRVPADVVKKVVLAGIPVLVSKSTPTATAIALARQYHLTLICSARSDHMTIFAS